MAVGKNCITDVEPASIHRFLYPLILALLTLTARLLFHGPVYFADGPGHIQSILQKTYVIQPPGYWLFNRTAGLFPNAVLAISTINITFSVAGVIAFYFAACFFCRRGIAFLAALAYSSVFYVWFAAEVHSTYVSQAFFPVAAFCALLLFEKLKADRYLAIAAILFAIGAGFRPSDGLFLLPMVVFYAVTRLPRRKAAFFLAAICAMDLAWIIPTFVAYNQAPGGLRWVFAYSKVIATHKSVISGLSSWLANVTRFALPICVAFWAILPAAFFHAVRNWSDWRVRMLLIWIVPGSLFFTFSYISDAPYLDFLTPAILLLALGAPRMLGVTALCNAAVFLAFSPTPSHRLPVNAWDSIVGNCTRYGIQHQKHANLSDLQGTRSITSP